MAFRFRQDEPAADGLRRIAREQAVNAADIGAEKVAGDAVAESIHEARTRCKKLRGLLRLVRPRLGAVFHDENSVLRDAAKRLSAARDAAVLRSTFEEITRNCDVDSESLTRIQNQLHEPLHDDCDNDDAARLGAFRQTLGSLLERIADWPIEGEEFAVIQPGLADTYRRGRKAMKQALRSGTDAEWHDWRKRAKDHWYHIRLLRNAWKPVMKAREAELDTLNDLLGDDHDLAVLSAKLHCLQGFEESLLQPIFQRIEIRRTELKSRAKMLGARLYAETPKAFQKRMRNYWNAWRR